jgi:methionine biosynthesis protein MetW
LGCGDGSLLDYLRTYNDCHGYGLDIDIQNIIACTEKKISVFHGNLDTGLEGFSDQSYDVVILSLTLQQVKNPEFVLQEMLRVGKKGIITFPNFAHWKCRMQIFLGQAPKNDVLPYEWYNTPNIRMITIYDFKTLCRKMGITIEQEISIYKSKFMQRMMPLSLSNLCCEKALFIVTKEIL